VQVPAGEERKFSALMTTVGFTEMVTVGAIDRGLIVQRSCTSLFQYKSEQRFKVLTTEVLLYKTTYRVTVVNSAKTSKPTV